MVFVGCYTPTMFSLSLCGIILGTKSTFGGPDKYDDEEFRTWLRMSWSGAVSNYSSATSSLATA